MPKSKKPQKKESRSLTNMIEYLIKKEISAYERQHGEVALTEADLYIE